MKKLMLIAYGICFVLSQSRVSAQDADKITIVTPSNKTMPYRDTLVINLQDNDKILLIGKEPADAAEVHYHSMHRMIMHFQKADSLKMLFLNDFEKAVSEQTITKEAQRVYYFVHGSGKRRLKAENPDYSDDKVDVAYEIKRLKLNIPQYQYFIYDLSTGYEIQIYINDPNRLNEILNDVSINDAIHYKGITRKDMRRYYKLEINTDDGYSISRKTGGSRKQSYTGVDFGIGMLGNLISPVTKVELGLEFKNKYSIGQCRVGMGITAFPLVSTYKGSITDVSRVSSYDLRAAFNLYNIAIVSASKWIGLQAGLMRSDEIDFLNNAFKWGFTFQYSKSLNLSVDWIKGKNGNKITSVTWTFSF